MTKEEALSLELAKFKKAGYKNLEWVRSIYLNARICKGHPGPPPSKNESGIAWDIQGDIEWGWSDPGKAWEYEDYRWMHTVIRSSTYNHYMKYLIQNNKTQGAE